MEDTKSNPLPTTTITAENYTAGKNGRPPFPYGKKQHNTDMNTWRRFQPNGEASCDPPPASWVGAAPEGFWGGDFRAATAPPFAGFGDPAVSARVAALALGLGRGGVGQTRVPGCPEKWRQPSTPVAKHSP